MEGLPNNNESKESHIDKLIEELAEREEMAPEDIQSDINTFLELAEEDPDAGAYFEILAEKLGISIQEMLEYAKKKNG